MSEKDHQQSTAVDGDVASPTEDGKFDLNKIIASAVAAEAEANMAHRWLLNKGISTRILIRKRNRKDGGWRKFN